MLSVSSARFIGRDQELAAIGAAVAAAAGGQARVVLIDGDAGLGKSRLVATACARAAAEGVVTAAGGGVPLGEASVAFAPFLEVLRQLQDLLGAERFAGLGGPGLIFPDARRVADQGMVFERMLSFLVALGESRTAVVVLEDLHWADASTRDLIVYLARMLNAARITLVLTYRGDELDRKHPLRSLLDDLERNPRLVRIRLRGLSRPEVAELVAEIGDGTVMPPEQVDDLLARTQGNPFYVEELVAAGPSGGQLPARLSDVILSRLERLPGSSVTVLRQATILGDDIDDELLAAVTGQPLGEVTRALRDGLAHQFLTIAGRRCRFRHALHREALYEDLLPGERARLHRAAALAMDGSAWARRLPEHTRRATLAYHWDAAGDVFQAFTAAIGAAAAAERVGALGEAAAWYERALPLWDRVPSPARQAGMERAQLLMRAAEATFASLSPRAVVLAEGALDALAAGAEPEERAAITGRIARMNWAHCNGPASAARYEEAVALLAGRPLSAEKARALAGLGQNLVLRGLHHRAGPVLRDALEAAREVAAPQVEAQVLCSLGAVLTEEGRVEQGLSMLRLSLDLAAQRSDVPEDIIRAYCNYSFVLESAGRYGEAERAAAEGAGIAARIGHRRGWAFLLGNRVSALTRCGDWDEAARVCAELDEHGWGDFAPVGLARIPLLIGRGCHEAAGEYAARLLELTAGADDVQFCAAALMRAGQQAAATGHWSQARDRLARALAITARAEEQFYQAMGFGLAMSAEAAFIRARASHGPQAGGDIAAAGDLASRLLASSQAFAASLAASGIPELPETSAWLATVAAAHEAVWRRHDPDQWAAAGRAWARLGQPAQAAAAQCREVDALLRVRGDRVRAAEVARSALAVAERLGAAPLAAELRLLARQGRLDLRSPAAIGADAAVPLAGLNLTQREAEVLALLAVGRSNREIGRELFITEKTASVHVSNVMQKLGVKSRYAAAAVGSQLGLGAAPDAVARG